MTDQEFNAEMERLEACWPTRLDAPKLMARREVLWERLKELPITTLRAARNTLIDSGLEYLPSVPEILSACRDESYEPAPNPILRSRFKPVAHTCSPQPEPSIALETLAIASPYETAHITCPEDIHATCPRCGAQRLEVGLFADIMKHYPDATKGWTHNFKGLLLCRKCEKHG